MKKKLAVIMCAVMLISTAIISIKAAGAEETVTLGDLSIKGENLTEGDDYSYKNHLLTIKSGKAMTISSHGASTGGATQLDRIEVDAPDVEVNLAFDNLNINMGTNNLAAFKINAANKVTVTLLERSDNSLMSGVGYAGLQNGSIPLVINGKGSLSAEGYLGAGIGGGNGENGEHITIAGSVKVEEAKGFDGGAGIGGGKGGSGIDINISGSAKVKARGAFTASSDSAGAGIGGGKGGNADKITISDSADVTANGYVGSAGIGGGKGGTGKNIYISGGKVNATGIGGAGIGGGDGGNGESIYISGGEVNAYGGYWDGANTDTIDQREENYFYGGGAGIGGGRGGSGSDIEISSGNVIATGTIGAGIGGGGGTKKTDDHINYATYMRGGNGENIRILGGNVTAECQSRTEGLPAKQMRYGSSAGIGGGSGGYAKDITITTDGKVNATGGSNGGAGIGGGQSFSYTDYSTFPGVDIYEIGYAEDIKIGGSGTIIATAGGDEEGSGYGNNGGAGIGGGKGGYAETIIINDQVTIVATGKKGGAGIGGGESGNVNYGAKDIGYATGITINGGKEIKATSNSGAGIGGGSGGYGGADGDGKGITITGGAEVTATSETGAGIGGGSNGDGNNITIDSSSSTITAKSTNYSGGAGIGGGSNGDGNNITIKSGKIIAEGGGGAGIGGGAAYSSGGNGENIKINGGDITATSSMGAGIGGGLNGSGTEIKISGSKTVVNAQSTQSGAGIGAGTSGINAEVEISGGNINATGYYGVCIGGGNTKTDITISGGNVTAIGASSYTGIGIGSSKGETIIVINEDNEDGNTTKVIAQGKEAGIKGSDEVKYEKDEATGKPVAVETIHGKITISGGDVTATGATGIDCVDITIGGEKTKVEATGTAGVGIDGGSNTVIYEIREHGTWGNVIDRVVTVIPSESVTISGGDVTANGGSGAPGIYGTDVYIGEEGTTTSTSYPWVHTNKINSTNDHSESYHGIIFDENYTDNYGEEITDEKIQEARKEHKPAGVVYGDVSLTELEEPYVIESGETLNVHKDGKLTTGNKLILKDGAVLYLEEDANLDTYKDENLKDGTILHEETSKYGDDGVCEICGSIGTHEWATPDADPSTWNYDTTHHWHKCLATKDCSIRETPIYLCNLLNIHEKNEGYAEHIFGAPVKSEDGSKLIYNCTTCLYSYTVEKTLLYKYGENNAPLGEAEFGIYSDAAGNNEIASGTSSDDGKVTFDFDTTTVINPDTIYYIRETKAPDGYKKSDTVYTVEFTSKIITNETDGSITIEETVKYGTVGSDETTTDIPECVNTKINPGTIQINKVDNSEIPQPLAGAQFGLYSDAGCQTQVGSGTSAIDGTVSFETIGSNEIELDKTYYIKEIQAPTGYTASNDVFTAKVGTDGTVTYGDNNSITPLKCVNTKINPGTIQIIKVDDSEIPQPLAGAQFGLYSDAGCQTQVGSGTSAIGGTVSFETIGSNEIELGKTYYIKEIQAPTGYTASNDVFTAKVGTDGTVTYGDNNSITPLKCVNTKINPGTIRIIKVDDSEIPQPLAGAQFGLYSDANCQTQVGSGTSAIDGTVSFEITDVNTTYYIKEIAAPEGYTASTEVFVAKVGTDGKVTYGDDGSVNIPVCKNEKSTSPDEPVTPPDEPVTPPDEPVTPPDEPVTPPDEPVTPPNEPVTPPNEPVTPPNEPVTPPNEPVTPPVEPFPPIGPYPPVVPISPVVTPTVTESDTEEEIIYDEPYYEDVSSAAGINDDGEYIDHFNSSKNCAAVIILIASFAVGFILHKKASK